MLTNKQAFTDEVILLTFLGINHMICVLTIFTEVLWRKMVQLMSARDKCRVTWVVRLWYLILTTDWTNTGFSFILLTVNLFLLLSSTDSTFE